MATAYSVAGHFFFFEIFYGVSWSNFGLISNLYSYFQPSDYKDEYSYLPADNLLSLLKALQVPFEALLILRAPDPLFFSVFSFNKAGKNMLFGWCSKLYLSAKA